MHSQICLHFIKMFIVIMFIENIIVFNKNVSQNLIENSFGYVLG